MRWSKVVTKFLKNAVMTGLSSAAVVIQTTPPGQPIDKNAILTAVIVSILGGSFGAGTNYAKHRNR